MSQRIRYGVYTRTPYIVLSPIGHVWFCQCGHFCRWHNRRGDEIVCCLCGECVAFCTDCEYRRNMVLDSVRPKA